LSINIEENLPAVNIDAVAIEQALLNLLDNAVKYSPANKTVRLTAIAEGRNIKVSIADNGIGIATKDRSRIFDKFYRSETGEAMNITGSGIGLTLVKDIIEAHGGDISVESRRNKGSTFIIRIPII
jgi:signal transduction histidine kinase